MDEQSVAAGSGARQGVTYAVLAAVLFGASTPFAKLLLRHNAPVVLAGLLYAGSGLGLSIWIALRAAVRARPAASAWRRCDLLWLAAAILCGGVLAPVLMLTGLRSVAAANASLLLNLEGVFTALLAWFVFRENFDRRVLAGLFAIITGGVVLAWPARLAPADTLGSACIAGACICWAIDNNLTRKVSIQDPCVIAALKGVTAGAVNLGIGAYLGLLPTGVAAAAGAALLGLAGYGISLTLFVLALRHLGAARTGAYFSTAPFIGAVASLVVFRYVPGPALAAATLLMGLGVWLHLTEKHAHHHTHTPLLHTHSHWHDEHHRHTHDFDWDGREPHEHEHRHEPLAHAHAHFPDIHHRHEH